MEAIFRYVLDQFNLIYKPEQLFDIHYGLNTTSQIQIKPGNTDFFKKNLSLPDKPPVYHSWQNQQIPFWFEAEHAQEIITYSDGKAIIQVDVIANIFYFLSGWQEYHSTVRDKYGRFPYQESLQKKHGFIIIPVVNYYFDILKTAIEQVYSIKLQSALASEAVFTTCLTHDVDNCQTAWLVEGRQALQQRKYLNFLRKFWKTATRLLYLHHQNKTGLVYLVTYTARSSRG